MSLLRKLRDYLEADLAGAYEWLPKVYFLPDDMKEGIVLLADPSGAVIDHELPGWQEGRFQMVVRAKDYGRGEEIAVDMVERLTMLNVELPLFKVHYVRPRHTPLPYPRSKGGGVEFSVNFDYCVVSKE